MEPGHLLRHHLIDPDARYVRIALRHLFCSIKAVGAHDREAGDGFTSQWQILCSSFRDFSTTTEMAPVLAQNLKINVTAVGRGCERENAA